MAAWLDAHDERSHERVSVDTATVAMILNGLGFSNRQLYLIPQFFADKPLETLLGPGITAADLNDDCLGRTLDWLYAHDPTTLFAGIATQARRVFGIRALQVHVDTTSFSVSGVYVPEAGDLDATTIAITYSYSRDHRADLKQWMPTLATTHDGDVPLFLRPPPAKAVIRSASWQRWRRCTNTCGRQRQRRIWPATPSRPGSPWSALRGVEKQTCVY